ncbi:MAG: iron-containing alcohol dehydrogenase [Gammaproteobacteria bacterium]|nr:iron-containing alcohol dehydrogenase [Gammaproteobacteria bacterium]
MQFAPFAISRLPRIIFGRGRIKELATLAANHGRKILLVTGARSLRATSHWQTLIDDLQQCGMAWPRHWEPFSQSRMAWSGTLVTKATEINIAALKQRAPQHANSRGNSMLINPIVLNDDEVTQIVLARI